MSPALQLSRGLFWWKGEQIPRRHFAPANAVAGDLEIGEDGVASLKLDGVLPRPRLGQAFADALDKIPIDREIWGILVSRGESVCLGSLEINGSTLSSFAPDTERFLAHHSLVFCTTTSHRMRLKARSITFSLEGYEQWIWMNNIETEFKAGNWRALYKRNSKFRWLISGGHVAVEFFLDRPIDGKHHEIHVKEVPYIRLSFRKSFDLDRAKELSLALEDFFVLITDDESGLPFPTLRIRRHKWGIKFFFARNTRKKAPFVFSNCWLPLRAISVDFGSMFSNWAKGLDRFGPGFHLYLGNRRGISMYPEHRFASLIWGLESLHRRSTSASTNAALAKKKDRILQEISKPRDRKWLSKVLEGVGQEPSLAMRLHDLLSSICIKFDNKELTRFTDTCAKLRNNLSHFGGQREETEEYRDFLKKVIEISLALDLLYHVKLLQEIGAPQERLIWWFKEGFREYQIKQRLATAGLTKLL